MRLTLFLPITERPVLEQPGQKGFLFVIHSFLYYCQRDAGRSDKSSIIPSSFGPPHHIDLASEIAIEKVLEYNESTDEVPDNHIGKMLRNSLLAQHFVQFRNWTTGEIWLVSCAHHLYSSCALPQEERDFVFC